jgi:hypothetical protein
VEFSRIDRRPVTITVTATNPDGTPATLAAVDVALLPAASGPTGGTAWTTTDFADGAFEVLVAGPDADPAGALVIPRRGGCFWIKDPAADSTQAVPAGRVSLI